MSLTGVGVAAAAAGPAVRGEASEHAAAAGAALPAGGRGAVHHPAGRMGECSIAEGKNFWKLTQRDSRSLGLCCIMGCGRGNELRRDGSESFS